MSLVEVPGGRIQYRFYQPHAEQAAQRTPLIVTHGGPGGSSIGLYDALNGLADQRPLIFYDQLGSHGSPAELSREQMTLERFAEEPLRLMDALAIETAQLLGHSWGGSVITQFCLNHPERVKALVLSSPLLSTLRWIEDCNTLLKQLSNQGLKGAALEEAFNRRHFCRSNPAPRALAREQERSNKKLYEQMWGPSEFAHAGMLGDLDFFPRLREIKAMTLLICGEHDTATPQTMEQAKQRIGPLAKTVVLPDAGHKTYIDQHSAYVQTVESFLARNDTANDMATTPSTKAEGTP